MSSASNNRACNYLNQEKRYRMTGIILFRLEGLFHREISFFSLFLHLCISFPRLLFPFYRLLRHSRYFCINQQEWTSRDYDCDVMKLKYTDYDPIKTTFFYYNKQQIALFKFFEVNNEDSIDISRLPSNHGLRCTQCPYAGHQSPSNDPSSESPSCCLLPLHHPQH